MTRTMITPDQAKALATKHAYTITDPDWGDLTEEAKARRLAAGETEHGSVILHCMGGFTGADWDLDGVLALIDRSRACAFLADDPFGHCLAVQEPEKDGRYPTWRFRVPADALTAAANNT